MKRIITIAFSIIFMLTSCSKNQNKNINTSDIFQDTNYFEIIIDGKKTIVDYNNQEITGVAMVMFTGETKTPDGNYAVTSINYHNPFSSEFIAFNINTLAFEEGTYTVFTNEIPSEGEATSDNILIKDMDNGYYSYNAPSLGLTPGTLEIKSITDRVFHFTHDGSIPGYYQAPPRAKGPHIWRRIKGSFNGIMANVKLIEQDYVVKDSKKVEVNFDLYNIVWNPNMFGIDPSKLPVEY